MMAFERRELIVARIHRNKKVFVSPLAKEFNVSEETIRRDLEKMEQEGVVTRTYGGATINSHTKEDIPYKTRNSINIESKKKIARKAISLVSNDDSLMVDTSSTVFETLKKLNQQQLSLDVITNSIDMLHTTEFQTFNIISTGGQLRPKSRSLIGTVALNTVQQYYVDSAILSCKSLAMDNGIMDSNDPEAVLKRTMGTRANKVILLADSSKFDKSAFVKVFEFQQINYLVTETKPPKDWLTFLKQHDVTLIY